MRSLALIILTILSIEAFAQKYFTRTGQVSFFSKAPLENIEAHNNQASCIVDLKTGEVVSKILLKAFEFDKALMQEHFNENYVESDKYPQALLKAKVSNANELDFSKNSKQKVILIGELTIKNITKEVLIDSEFENKNGLLISTARFIVLPEDYDIKIPRAVRDNIAKEVEVSVNFNLEPFNR